MRISGLIKHLTKLQEKYGDLTVAVPNWMDRGQLFDKAQKPRVVTVKDHYRGFFLAEALCVGGWANGPAFKQPYQCEIEARPDKKVVLLGSGD